MDSDKMLDTYAFFTVKMGSIISSADTYLLAVHFVSG
jgi:hypothetical protein